MEYRELGQTGLIVSRLCFGSLTVSPLQANLSAVAGGQIIEAAFSLGVNFLDTAESYQNYPQIRWALQRGWSDRVVIATKSYAVTGEEMRQSLERARRELDRDYIDIFLLHEQESGLTIRGHAEALEYLAEAKCAGLIRAIGISTHAVAGVRSAALNPLIDVIHPLINRAGIGILDGTASEMVDAIKFAAQMGKGVYGMKALAGGHLRSDVEQALRFVLDLPELSSIAVGMQSVAEVEANVLRFSGEEVPEELAQSLLRRPRRLHVEEYCVGCGTCVAACRSQALQVRNGRVEVDTSRCVFCGYCGRVCPDFCLKVI
jgi:aryl-alcohol dehydrogenase-like predicted oxidoreductase